MYRDRRARWGGCALPPDGPAASGRGRERPSSCATRARFAGEGALRPRSTAAIAVGMLWSAGGVGRGVGTVACAPGSAADFAVEVVVSSAVAAGLALTAVPPQVSRPDGGAGSAEVPAPPIPRADSSAGSAATAEVRAPPILLAGSSADRAAGAGVLPPALVPSGAGGTPGCSCALRFAGEAGPPAGPAGAFGSGAWPTPAFRRPPPRPRGGRPGS